MFVAAPAGGSPCLLSNACVHSARHTPVAWEGRAGLLDGWWLCGCIRIIPHRVTIRRWLCGFSSCCPGLARACVPISFLLTHQTTHHSWALYVRYHQVERGDNLGRTLQGGRPTDHPSPIYPISYDTQAALAMPSSVKTALPACPCRLQPPTATDPPTPGPDPLPALPPHPDRLLRLIEPGVPHPEIGLLVRVI
jgi:hypothetical protein